MNNNIFKIIAEHEISYFEKICFINKTYSSFQDFESNEDEVQSANLLSAIYSPLCLSIVFGELKLTEFLLSDLRVVDV